MRVEFTFCTFLHLSYLFSRFHPWILVYHYKLLLKTPYAHTQDNKCLFVENLQNDRVAKLTHLPKLRDCNYTIKKTFEPIFQLPSRLFCKDDKDSYIKKRWKKSQSELSHR